MSNPIDAARQLISSHLADLDAEAIGVKPTQVHAVIAKPAPRS